MTTIANIRLWATVVAFALVTAAEARTQAAVDFTTAPSVRIARFKGDRAAAISYTFDDGLRDQYTLAVPMLNEVGFKGTFFVIPSKVSRTVEDAERRQNDKRAWGTITWGELRQMAAQGHEIGSHTWSHPNLTKLTAPEVDAQLKQSYDAIRNEIGRTPLTLAYPFNACTPEIERSALKYYAACREHQIGVGGSNCTVVSLNKWVDELVDNHKWGVIMAHAIGRGYAAFTDPTIFRSHLGYVKCHETNIWVDTFANVARYEKERADAKITVLTNEPGHMTLTLASNLNPDIYNVPLTLVLNFPKVASAHAERIGRELPVRVFPGAIQVEAVSGPEPITVTWHY